MPRPCLASISPARDRLDQAFERNADQLSNDEFQGYKLASPLDAALQLLVEGSDYDDFGAFLDRLRADGSLRDRYNALKRRWDGRPMDEYRAAKQAFIEAALNEAGPGQS